MAVICILLLFPHLHYAITPFTGPNPNDSRPVSVRLGTQSRFQLEMESVSVGHSVLVVSLLHIRITKHNLRQRAGTWSRNRSWRTETLLHSTPNPTQSISFHFHCCVINTAIIMDSSATRVQVDPGRGGSSLSPITFLVIMSMGLQSAVVWHTYRV